ncbi:4-hydroxy-tetrahydrodipicolinate synthase [Noviherbaspirillum cavernae]|uniref:4-hydroxy-tetrahydrodipicolinate synthase n=1 Tax=Noviherbaspirillum cavernae TaxID=2320862 RepID=A0A418X4K1_9BURK|nr:4-hydroxy-tetrahydrodipicolinate synthase [Noviherbaspirillum cavernae]RJG07408.1 4-hydroxy-tetrahydrodipicolinate synthase [Noviherbaspirillum cavernae]
MNPERTSTTPLFEGIWVPIVTPFRDGHIDLDAAQGLTTHLVDSGVHGLVVCGTTGEAATLDDGEQADMLAAVLEAAGRRCPVAIGIGGSDTRAVARQAARYNRAPLAGLLISAPSYVRPSQQGILHHFRAIAEVTDKPIALYNIPARTGVNIDAATALSLSADPRFAAIKECGGNMPQLAALINHTPLKVLCGDDALILVTLCLGGHGAITAAAHIRPDLFVRLFDLVRSNRIGQARTLFKAMLPLIQLLFSEPNPGPVKAALAMQGWIGDELRLPMTPMSADGKKALAIALERMMALPG